MADTTPTLREAAQQALEALAPLANATTPAEREALTDADAQAADAASCDLRAARAEQAATPAAEQAPHPSYPHITQPYTLEEIRAQIASHDYSAELLLQHAMLLLDDAEQAEPGAERMILTVLAAKLAQAVAKDNDDPDGHDIASGLYGPAVSEWLREVAKEMTPAAMIAAAPPAPARQEWQPIETAPRDGTNMLLWWEGRVVLGYWNKHTKPSPYPRSGWCGVGAWAGGDMWTRPTHWQPLPAAPITAAPAEGEKR